MCWKYKTKRSRRVCGLQTEATVEPLGDGPGILAVILDLSSFLSISLSIRLPRIGKHFLCCLWKQTVDLSTPCMNARKCWQNKNCKVYVYFSIHVYTYTRETKTEICTGDFSWAQNTDSMQLTLPQRPGHNCSAALSTADVACGSFLNLPLCYVWTALV